VNTYYICNASRYLVPNLVPLLELGFPEKIDGIILLIGAGDPPSETDRAEALDPAERFCGVIQSLVHPDRNLRIERVCHAAQDYQGWEKALCRKIAELGDGEYHLNVTAGTTAMTLGGFVGLLHVQQQLQDRAINARVFAYHPQPRRIIEVYPGSREKALGKSRYITLDTYLQLHGWQELACSNRLAAAERAQNRSQLTNWLHRRVARNSRLALNSLNKTFTPLAKRNLQVREITSNKMHEGLQNLQGGAAVIDEVVSEATRFGLVHRDGNRIVCTDEDAAKYLAGRWFEEFCADRVRQALKGAVPDAEVYHQLELGNRGGDLRVRELDVAVFRGDQLYAIECKTAMYRAGGEDVSSLDYRNAIIKMSDIKRSLVGPFGIAGILNLRRPSGEQRARRYFESVDQEAKRGGIALWCGLEAVEEACIALLDNLHRGDPTLPLPSRPALSAAGVVRHPRPERQRRRRPSGPTGLDVNSLV
jgi:hypothetical protein